MPPAAAIAGAAVVGAGASIIAGNKAAKAQKNAATQQAQSAAAQIAEEQRQYDQTREDYAPYRETGYKALDTLSSLYGVNPDGSTIDPTAALKATPGYQFTLDQGLKAIDRGNAARGVLNSGGADKARLRYAEGIASSTYDSYANRLAALSGVGQSATGSTAAAGQAATAGIGAANQQIGNAAINAGNARASSYANTGSAINNGASNLASLYLYQQGGGFSTAGKLPGGISNPNQPTSTPWDFG